MYFATRNRGMIGVSRKLQPQITTTAAMLNEAPAWPRRPALRVGTPPQLEQRDEANAIEVRGRSCKFLSGLVGNMLAPACLRPEPSTHHLALPVVAGPIREDSSPKRGFISLELARRS